MTSSVQKVASQLSRTGARSWRFFFELVILALQSGQNLALVAERGESAKPPLLDFAVTCETQQVKHFAADDFFTTRNSKVKIRFINDTFNSAFGKKVEENVQAATLRAHRLTARELDAWVIVALGKENYKTSLAQIASLMEQQPNGEDGILLSNGWWNIFYVPDADGILWAVGVRWGDDGWRVRAYSVGYPFDWIAGYRVFGCDSQKLVA